LRSVCVYDIIVIVKRNSFAPCSLPILQKPALAVFCKIERSDLALSRSFWLTSQNEASA